MKLAGPAYVLRVTAGKLALAGPLGWDLAMLRRLDAIRAVLDGDAAKAMDRLIGRLSGYRRQWEAAEPKPPASSQPEQKVLTIQVSPHGFAVDGAEVKTRRAMEEAVRKLEVPHTTTVLIKPDGVVEWSVVLDTYNFLVKEGFRQINWSGQ